MQDKELKEKLSLICKETEKEIGKIVTDNISRAYTEYLPHLEYDFYSNVYHHSREQIEKFLNGEKSMIDEIVQGRSAKDLRKKIARENPQLIGRLINDDLKSENESLHKQVEIEQQRNHIF